MKWFLGMFTDALGRPEPKMVLGVPTVVTAVVFGVVTRDWVGFGALFGAGCTLCGFSALADHKVDMAKIAAEGK